jgi:hypothetical protein
MSAVSPVNYPVLASTVIEHPINQENWIHFEDSLALAKLSTAAAEPFWKPQKLSHTRTSIEVSTSEDVLVSSRQDATDVASPTV